MRPWALGFALQPNGLAVLDALGVLTGLQEQGAELGSMLLYDEQGRVLAHAPVPDFGPGLDHALVVRRQTLSAVLLHAIRAEGLIELHRGAMVVSSDGDGVVAYQLDGVERRLAASLVVGADGVGSQVRRTGRFQVRPIRPGHRYARTIVDGEPDLAAGECWSRLGLLGWAPLGGGTTYVYASVSDRRVESALAARDLGAFVARWGSAVPVSTNLLQRVESIDDLLINQAATVRCGTYADGRTVLVGDAAHAMAPNLGQGANSALIDAAVLVHELTNQADRGTALATYTRIRRRAVGKVQRNAERLARLGHLRNPIMRTLRASPSPW